MAAVKLINNTETFLFSGQQQIIELIKFLKQTDQDTLTKFITTWRSWKIIP